MKYLTISLLFLFPFISFSQTAPGWPGNQMGTGIFQSPELVFRGSVLSFRNTSTNLYYIGFEGNLPGTSTEYTDGGHTMFIISADDKASVSAVYTAFAAGKKFMVQYKKDNFMNRNILDVKSFYIIK